MITAIRDVRLARGLTLDEVARRCVPPTTPQTLSRLETGNRTVSVAWLNRIAAAIGVRAADLVTLPARATLPVVATLGPAGATAPRTKATSAPPLPTPGMIAVTVSAAVGDYRAGDVVWCTPLALEAWPSALHHDILTPLPAGRFAFGRLVAHDASAVTLIPPKSGARAEVVPDATWIARVTHLLRTL